MDEPSTTDNKEGQLPSTPLAGETTDPPLASVLPLVSESQESTVTEPAPIVRPVPPAPTESPVIAPPQVVPASPKEPWFSGNRAILLILSVVVLVATGTAAFLFYRGKTQKPLDQVMIAPTPIPRATPTPLRIPSAIATQSAFLSLEAETASLSGDLQMYQVQDPSLSPPVMDLPLGFSN